MLNKALNSLHNYCEKQKYKGWDVFDGLNSILFKKSIFYKSSLIRLLTIQFFKRCPLNIRKFSLVPKGYNAKGLALFVSGMVLCGKFKEAEILLERIKNLICNGFSGISWGYNFDWQARAFFVPAGTPNIVTTVFVSNAILDYIEAKRKENGSSIKENSEGYFELVKDACEFILNELILFEDNKSLCFGYIPGENARVHNANMLGAALLGRVYKSTDNSEYLKKSRKALTYSINALNPDYSWPYGERSHHKFIDNFHTGYNLVALKEWMDYTGEYIWNEELAKSYTYFLKSFWLENGCPKYYNNSLYPIDVHCSAQGIVTCIKLKEYDSSSLHMAQRMAKWAIEKMQSKKNGYFYYQKTKYYTNKIPYIRWSQAWMYYALSLLNREINAKN